jgi:serine/threonine-protein kinase
MGRSDPDATVGGAGAERSPAGGAREDELAPGARAGEYVVERFLAGGGHGNVYLAQHRVLGRRAAVKVMLRRIAAMESMVARFVLEAQLVNRIRHPGIVDIYDLGTLADGRPYCVMELLPGRSLRELLASRGRLSCAETLSLLEPVCSALEAAHAAGVVHRDVKASNVMVDEGPPLAVKLLDFGVAKVTEPGLEGLTVAGERIGSSASMAPEQILGRPVSARTDVYALGVLVYQLLTGELPFPGERAEVERLHLTAPPPHPSRVAPVAPGVDALVARCLAKQPEDRFSSPGEVAAALRRALGAVEPAAEALAPAIAVHAAAAPADRADEEALLSAADAVAAMEAELRGAGLQIAISTAESVLAIALLAAEPAPGEARRRIVQLARDVHARAVLRAAGRLLGIRVAVHADAVRVRTGPGGPEVTGGPLCDAAAWSGEGEGLRVSAAAGA